MANYKFTHINAGLTIKAPAIEVKSILDRLDGTADVDIVIALGNPQAKAVVFSVTLTGYTYEGEQAILSEVQTWVTSELKQYEV